MLDQHFEIEVEWGERCPYKLYKEIIKALKVLYSITALRTWTWFRTPILGGKTCPEENNWNWPKIKISLLEEGSAL